MNISPIDIRALESIAEFEEAEALQRTVWDMPTELDVVPLHLLVTAQKNGGVALGAFVDGTMIGFLFGFLGRASDGRWKHCSHMMGVLDQYRGQGVGERLKQRQRDLVLNQGLDLVTWTYDPLEVANAALNIGKLGATCRTYLRNVYGELRDELNKGLPTDRFQVDWLLNSRRVAERSAVGRTGRPSFRELVASGVEVVNQVELSPEGFLQPGEWARPAAPRALVEVPWSIQRIKSHDISLAHRWRLETRALFEVYFDAGYTVTDVVVHGEDKPRRVFYLLDTAPLD